MERLSATKDSSHGLDTRTNHIVVGILGNEGEGGKREREREGQRERKREGGRGGGGEREK